MRPRNIGKFTLKLIGFLAMRHVRKTPGKLVRSETSWNVRDYRLTLTILRKD